jgi:hypothetical protein
MKPSNKLHYTSLSDWLAVRDFGHDDPGRRPGPERQPKEIGAEVVIVPAVLLPGGFSLHGNPEEQRGRQRRVDANRVLAKHRLR